MKTLITLIAFGIAAPAFAETGAVVSGDNKSILKTGENVGAGLKKLLRNEAPKAKTVSNKQTEECAECAVTEKEKKQIEECAECAASEKLESKIKKGN
jgi:hypothetical protein